MSAFDQFGHALVVLGIALIVLAGVAAAHRARLQTFRGGHRR